MVVHATQNAFMPKAHSYAYWLAAQRITLVNPVSTFYPYMLYRHMMEKT
jgi:hypothetical protein